MKTEQQNTDRGREQRSRARHANGRRRLAEFTRKATQRARQAWEEEHIQMAASTAAAIGILIFWNLAALRFFEAI